jgi:hypothetical protein
MKLSRGRAARVGAASIGIVVVIQVFSSVACYKHDLEGMLVGLACIAIPMLPAIISLVLPNPLRAVGASVVFVPWLVCAYVIDCVLPYSGGGASMSYVAVVILGTPCAILGAVVAAPVAKQLGNKLPRSKLRGIKRKKTLPSASPQEFLCNWDSSGILGR